MPAGDVRDVASGDLLEHASAGFSIAMGAAADRDDTTGVAGMTCGVSKRDRAAEGDAEHDRVFRFKSVADASDVVGPYVEIPLVTLVAIASAVTPLVDENDLERFAEDVDSWS